MNKTKQLSEYEERQSRHLIVMLEVLRKGGLSKKLAINKIIIDLKQNNQSILTEEFIRKVLE